MLAVYVCTLVINITALEQTDRFHEIWHRWHTAGGHSNSILPTIIINKMVEG
jgi:hypothetical protein